MALRHSAGMIGLVQARWSCSIRDTANTLRQIRRPLPAWGEQDGIANWRVMQRRIDALAAAGIPVEFHHYPTLGHGFGLGIGTEAEGWLEEAVAFWEAQM